MMRAGGQSTAGSFVFRMRIVHVVRQFYPAIGGFESVVYELASMQVMGGHAVRVVTLDRLFKAKEASKLPSRESVQGIEINRIPFFGSSRYPLAFSVLRQIRHADIVHVHAIDFFFDFLAWTKPLHRKTLIVSTHGGFFHTDFAARIKRIYFSTVTKGSIRWYDGVAAVSRADQDQFSRIRRRGLVCIENGVNTVKFADASSRAPIKSMIWIGRFSRNKRLDRLIYFFAALRKADPDWKLTIAGQPWDIGHEQLQELARATGVHDAVAIIKSPQDGELRTLIRECSVFVSCSDYEGFGLAAIEGMSAGLFPLLSDIAPFKRLVAGRGIGMNIDFRDSEHAPAAFLERWHEIVSDYVNIRSRSMAAASEFSWDNVGRQYQSLYEDALGTKCRTILEVPVFVGTQTDAVDRVDAAYESRKPTIVAFANAHTLNIAAIDQKFRDALKRSLVMNDGIGLDAASRILFGSPFPQNLNGTDFTPHYLENTKNNYRLFFLGGLSGVAERAAGRIMALCGRHEIAGCHDGYYRHSDTAAIVAKIRASQADVVLVAMGNPKQEIWLAENLEATGCRLGFGVGALFDFLSGEASRAPAWVRAARLEWCYRLLREPGRLWRRYLLGNPIFLMRVLGQWWSGARV